MTKKEIIKKLLKQFGQSYSEKLGIDLSSNREKDYFKWFLASIFIGAPISGTIAENTYTAFTDAGFDDPTKYTDKRNHHRILELIHDGGYTRYDYKTRKALVKIMKMLKEKYDGKVKNIINGKNEEEIKAELEGFYGVGPTTANIFLRPLRKILNVEPTMHEDVVKAAKKLGLIDTTDKEKALEQLQAIWKANKVPGKDFTDFEASLHNFEVKDFNIHDLKKADYVDGEKIVSSLL